MTIRSEQTSGTRGRVSPLLSLSSHITFVPCRAPTLCIGTVSLDPIACSFLLCILLLARWARQTFVFVARLSRNCVNLFE